MLSGNGSHFAIVIVVIVAIVVLAAVGIAARAAGRRPRTPADIAAREAEATFRQRLGTVIVAFSDEIRSEHMMVLAARVARGQNSELLAAYVIEVPFTLPGNAVMENERRAAEQTLASAKSIAKHYGVDVRTEVILHRQTPQGVLDLAKREKADLIVMGSYREGRYTGAPLGRSIETIAADAKCDVIIGVEGKHGTLLTENV
ncbi:MAG: universal stress protein [Candidatus Eremiobacteraeota bacterium]|nr:universal stress protein [Candidatus Eremiobacteraeota bacterium]